MCVSAHTYIRMYRLHCNCMCTYVRMYVHLNTQNTCIVFGYLLIQWAAYQRKMIRLCEGLPVIVSLTISESDAVTRAAVTALRNLSIDLLNKAIIGTYVRTYIQM